MSTYRERREARAARLREQAERKDAQAAAARQAERQILDRIPPGQPILVGHHSEKRHRRDLARADSLMRKSLDTGDAARARADEIERQADAAIYDDDPDALDRLRDKLAACEARRERMKQANAAYRREHRDELQAMTAYERGQAVPFPSYALSNLGGVISSTRQRIARLERIAEHGERGRHMTARRAGDCRNCDAGIEPGQPILWYRIAGEAEHRECPA